ncbi:RsmG family class I SAM-dependent methyltransferase [Aciditerrimonas ferrireducens]|uniref:Glucose-inhibited division protein B n=1 Tax=Aciditerrimonas ferrireducens TaxID=667306 RepID=A0ABV6BYV5_9ACTN
MPEALLARLAEAQHRGFLGPAPLEHHVAHSRGFLGVIERFAPPGWQDSVLVDLGPGGGVPGLLIAGWWPTQRLLLQEASTTRAAWLAETVEGLGWIDRVQVDARRAEEAGRDPSRRHAALVVTARAFGKPAVTAECGAPFLRPGGVLVVAEPPDGVGRWPVEGLSLLGLELAWWGAMAPGAHVAVLRAVQACPERYPRRTGVPNRRPLFGGAEGGRRERHP